MGLIQKYKKDMNLSNWLSFSRILLSIPMAASILLEEYVISTILAFVAAYTDMSDGYFARKYKQITELGKIIDPIADKIFVGITVIAMLISEIFPLWLAIVIVGRDTLILIAGLYAKKRVQIVIQSNIVGKATVTILGFTLIGYFLQIEVMMYYGSILTTGLIALSLIIYSYGLLKLLKAAEKTTS